VSDDDNSHGFQGFLVNRARKQQLAAQPATTREHDINRTARFEGLTPLMHWLSAAWSPDGSQVAVGGHHAKTGDLERGELEIWNGHTGQHEGHSTRHLRHDLAGRVISLSWAPDSTHLASIEKHAKSGQHLLHIRSEAEGKRAISLPAGSEMSQVTWSPDGSQLAVSARDAGSVLLIDPGNGQLRRTLEGVTGPVAWEPGGHRIAGPDGAKVAIFDAATGQRERTISGPEHKATAVAWATGGKVLAVSNGENIRVYNAENGEWLRNVPWATAEGDRSDNSTVYYLGWLDSGRYLFEFRKWGALSRDDARTKVSTIALWDVTTRLMFWFPFHETINHVQCPPAEILVGPKGGRQTLIFFDDMAPQVWEISGDLPEYDIPDPVM
jgi:WD40 repeat protein